MPEITSPKNPLLRDIRHAVARGGLTSDGLVVAESFHLLEEALRSDREVRCVLVAASVRSAVEGHVRGLANLRVAVVEDSVFSQVSSTQATQGVIALVQPPSWSLEQLLRGRSMVLILDGIQDPGNAGSIVRAAEAFGATGVVFLKGTVSPFNPKTLRASAGSLFRLPIIHEIDDALVRAALEQKRLDVYAAVPDGKKLLEEANLARRCAVVLGSEGHGVSERLRAGATELRIPTAGVESLNVAMAAGIILYEARRQRLLKE